MGWPCMTTKQTICASLIVKNEAAVIRRCLDSIFPILDAYAITDTGSTDGTPDIIREHMLLRNVPGAVQVVAPEPAKWWQRKRPFDFAKHRNIALDHARSFGCDYVLLIDADEELRLCEGATWDMPRLESDRYVANFRQLPEGRVWHRSLFVKASVPWYYKYPIHETLHTDGDVPATAAIFAGVEVHSYSDGGRNQDKLAKYRSDARACLAAIKAEPSEPRHWFYLGQSYAGAQEWLKAHQAYSRRVELGGGWEEEVWYSMFQLGPLKELLGYHWRDVLAAYLRAFNARPWRSEPLWFAGCLCRDNGEPALGEAYLRHACRIPYPSDSLLIDESVYAWRAADDLCGCLAMMGRAQECLDMLRRIADCKDVPPEQLPRILDNIEKAEIEVKAAA
jgi:glycosyltransferase involved in cell wall biosynthesis